MKNAVRKIIMVVKADGYCPSSSIGDNLYVAEDDQRFQEPKRYWELHGPVEVDHSRSYDPDAKKIVCERERRRNFSQQLPLGIDKGG